MFGDITRIWKIYNDTTTTPPPPPVVYVWTLLALVSVNTKMPIVVLYLFWNKLSLKITLHPLTASCDLTIFQWKMCSIFSNSAVRPTFWEKKCCCFFLDQFGDRLALVTSTSSLLLLSVLRSSRSTMTHVRRAWPGCPSGWATSGEEPLRPSSTPAESWRRSVEPFWRAWR